MKRLLAAILIGLFAAAPQAAAQAVRREPHVGYLYPAGGRQGTTVRVLVGGQFLRGLDRVVVSGEGVSAKVIEHYRPLRNLDADQRKLLQQRLAACAAARWSEMVERGEVKGRPPWAWMNVRPAAKDKPRPAGAPPDEADAKPVELPSHHLLNGWEDMSLRELAYTRELLVNRSKRQPNAQLEESLLIEVTIDKDAAAGDRELRIAGRAGLTNPMVFQVGALAEAREVEGNDPRAWDPLPAVPPLDLPVLINGQVMPGDVDRVAFRARAGEQLVIVAQARRLVPFLADAVPGWFQATLAVYDADGRELAFADDYRFDPDPVLRLDVPADGVYQLEIRDAIYRGREDFVYRVSIGALPFVTAAYPLAVRAGEPARLSVYGWNLPTAAVSVDPLRPGAASATVDHPLGPSNRVDFDALADEPVLEMEPNDEPARAQRLRLPAWVDGRIAEPGDVDLYRVSGAAGQELVVEVVARRLRSPLDSLVRVLDDSGNVIAWNDDAADKQGHLHRDFGVLTHHADSYLRFTAPAKGDCFVQVSDAIGDGSRAHAYALRVSRPQPDFALRFCPSSVNVETGRSTPITVHALRREGFDGPIRIAAAGLPAGFELDGAEVPAGRDRVRLTLTAPPVRGDAVVPLALEGTATIDGRAVTRPAAPVDDVMQAFLWRHLVPAEQALVAVTGPGRSGRTAAREGDGPVRVPVGGEASVAYAVPLPPNMTDVKLRLDEPPAGITLAAVEADRKGLRFVVRAADDAEAGLADNLIIDVSATVSWKDREGKARSQARSLGVLRALPIVIVE